MRRRGVCGCRFPGEDSRLVSPGLVTDKSRFLLKQPTDCMVRQATGYVSVYKLKRWKVGGGTIKTLLQYF